MQATREKYHLNSLQMLDMALHHAQAARHLLKMHAQEVAETNNHLIPATTLLYTAIELTFKAYLLQDHRKLRPIKGLFALFEHLSWIDLSQTEQGLLKQLSQQQAFRKGIDHALWDNEQQLQVFAHRILELHDRILAQMPLELHQDYRS